MNNTGNNWGEIFKIIDSSVNKKVMNKLGIEIEFLFPRTINLRHMVKELSILLFLPLWKVLFLFFCANLSDSTR